MLFNSPSFIFFFLPAAILVYYLLLSTPARSLAGLFICISSLVFYAWSDPASLFIILVSICVNFTLGNALARHKNRLLLIASIAFNLLWLGYFKYANFSLSVLNALLGTDWPYLDLLLPLGISFFTFQQIAWLADIYSGQTQFTPSFINYCCFITFFPQLVAGPIVHHSELMPQFEYSALHGPNWENIFNGMVLFSIGLAKKCLLADSLAPIVEFFFDKTPSMTLLEALLGSFCFTFQLYFDFSGYCDMALGCALFFNIRLPENFSSPYKSTSIRDFWRRWHITLSRWLRDYLYITLGGNRKGSGRTGLNLFATFLLGGLWHGAAWTFVIWGALHGIALIIHRIWKKIGFTLPYLAGATFTFIFVDLAWIVFRAPDRERLSKFGEALLGYNGILIRPQLLWERIENFLPLQSAWLGAGILILCAGIIFLAPNSSKILTWPLVAKFALALTLTYLSLITLLLPSNNPPFIYSRF